jgi:RHS repeat-associated protein
MVFTRFFFILLCFSLQLFAEKENVIQEEDDTDLSSSSTNVEWAKKPQKQQNKSAHAQYDDSLNLELSAEAEPLTTIAGCVNVSSGHLFFIDKDVLGNTVEPLPFIRYYDSGNNIESILGYGCGSQFPLWASSLIEGGRHNYARISEREGALTPYEARNDRGISIYSIDRRVFAKGYTNLNRAVTGGKANFVNWIAQYRKHPQDNAPYWKVQLGDGSKRYYGKQYELSGEGKRKLCLPSKHNYLLTREVKSNGNELHYSYDTSRAVPRLTQVKTLNQMQTVLNTLDFSYHKGHCTVRSSSGDSVTYFYYPPNGLAQLTFNLKKDHLLAEVIKQKLLREVLSSQNGKTSYKVMLGSTKEGPNWKVIQVNKPNGRFLKIDYERGAGKDEEDKVRTLIEPLGPNGEEAPSYRMSYAQDLTMVFDALDQPVLYHFDSQRRLIRRDDLAAGHQVWQDFRDFAHLHQLARQNLFEWSTKKGEEGWLRAKSVGKGKGLYHRRSYQYDSRGNVIRETVYGNITGEKPETFEDKRQTDHYSTYYEYSSDGRNLLTEKRTPEGWITRYSYLKGTNLPVRILHLYDGKIQEREFFEYDDNGQLKMAIEDDATGEEEWDLTNHTYRRIKYIQASFTCGPSYGKPQIVTEGYRDNTSGGFVLLKRTDYSYDERGNEIGQTVFLDNGLCYETRKAYDERRRVISETNAMGETTRYAYDENNNKIEEEVIGSGKIVSFSYDLMNRLIAQTEQHSSGRVATSNYHYDLLGRLVAETDPYMNSTYYAYDRLGNQICISKPFRQNVEGQIDYPTIRKTFNCLGQMTSQTDENGFTTHFSYNIYGNPTTIFYPDHSTERFIYYLNGKLKQKWFADGTSVKYRYDARGHLIEEETVDRAGTILKAERYAYKGSLLIAKTDAMGFVIRYGYDCAGRKICEDFHNKTKLITYTYDGLDRMTSKTQHGEHPLTEVYSYDGLDRPISKRVQDQQGTVYRQESYRYDIYGNQVSKEIQQTEDQTACYTSSYHSDETIQWKKDPLNNTKHWHYNHRHFNGIGQIVRCLACVDEMGRSVHEVVDAQGQLVRRDIASNDKSYSITHFHYDPKGQLVQQQTTVTAEGVPLREYAVHWEYNSRGWKIAETELPDGKRTTFDYDRCGRLIRRNKPDGVSLHYSYNALGQLISKSSSDGTVNYTYEVDLHGNPLKICDHVHQTAHHRKYDSFDRLIEEEIHPGIVLCYTYDPLDRLTGLFLPDGSSIFYYYTGPHLNAIGRHNANGQFTYICTCTSYDKRGHLLQTITPAGAVNFVYDLLGRNIQITASQWSSHLQQFDPVGNLLEIRQTDPLGELHGRFSYDRYDHLTAEHFGENNTFDYDSLGNCLTKNGQEQTINGLNQLCHDGHSTYHYDPNGNLIAQSRPHILYRYDALNRLTTIEKEGEQITLHYDAFNRCIQINDSTGQKQLLYQGDKEIGSIQSGRIKELCLAHPNPSHEHVFAFELDQQTYFPVQDYRYNISALYRQDGSIAQWTRYTSFGQQSAQGIDLDNPWRFANRRDIAGLSLFTHRLYHPQIRRWLTTDPIGFEDGRNL